MNRLYDNMTPKTKLKLELQYSNALGQLSQYKEEISKREPDTHSIIRSTFARQLGNLIFDIRNNVLETDLYSERLIDLLNKGLEEGQLFSKLKSKHAKIEHFYGRSAAAEKLLDLYIYTPPTFEEFCSFVIDYGSYHRTTGQENQDVKQAFNKGAENWIEAYEDSRIKLFEVEFIYDGNRVVRIDKKRRVIKEELKERFKY
jgi:hypothetical protein